MGPDTRRFFGCIATLECDGHRYARHFSSLEEVIAHCDMHGSRIICLSNPDTILRDLGGTRADINYAPNARAGSGQPADRVQFPEEKQLGSRKRMDLWAGGR